MHASLAVTPDGMPLGLTAVKVWSRDKFKGTAALKRRINPTRVPIDQKESVRWLDNLRQSTELIGAPGRCVHIGDRESDIYELFCLAQDLGTNFLVRSCVDRLAEGGDTTIAQVMGNISPSRAIASRRLPHIGLGDTDPVARCRCDRFTAEDTPIPNTAAACRTVPPD